MAPCLLCVTRIWTSLTWHGNLVQGSSPILAKAPDAIVACSKAFSIDTKEVNQFEVSQPLTDTVCQSFSLSNATCLLLQNVCFVKDFRCY